MAKIKNAIPKKLLSLKGKTTKEILSMDVYKLNKDSLKQVLNKLISTANKRVKRLEKKGIERYSPAYRRVQTDNADAYINSGKSIRAFSSRGLNTRNEIEQEVKRVKSFLESESSTIKGVESQREEIKKELGEFESIEQENEFWDVYHKWIKTHKNINARFNDSFQVRDMLFDFYITEERSGRGASSKLTRAINKMLNDTNTQDSDNQLVLENALKSGDKLNVLKPKNNIKS